MRFLYLSLLSFVFIATTALAFPSKTRLPEGETDEYIKLASLPTLPKAVTFPILSAQAALAVDLDSGVTLYEKNPDAPYLPASTTKIVTALVAMDFYPLDSVLTVGNAKIEGRRMGLLWGEKIKVDGLLYGLLMFSANDAAEVLAANFPGGRDTFVAAMNLKARELHLENSSFSNPSGLDEDVQVTTARDLIRIADYAMQNPHFAEIVRTKSAEVKSVDGRISHKLVNINELVGSVDGVLGVKTGWTEEARENLATYIERDGRRVMIVVLGSQDRFGETKELIEWIFENYEWKEVMVPN
jgi:D-alanyl-D-alanine carboxypeptidase (penicillin-binding protein 5/6)